MFVIIVLLFLFFYIIFNIKYFVFSIIYLFFFDFIELNYYKAELSIVIGSSLTVTPACEFPEYTLENGGKLVIINLMETPLNSKSHLRIFGKSDQIFQLLMKELKLSIPTFSWKSNIWVANKIDPIVNKVRIYYFY